MCLDEVGQVRSIAPAGSKREGLAAMDVGDRQLDVSLVLLDIDSTPVRVGDWLRVHTGLAVGVLDEAEAREVLAQRDALRSALAGYHQSEGEPGAAQEGEPGAAQGDGPGPGEQEVRS